MKKPEDYAQQYFIASINQDDLVILTKIIERVQTEAWNEALEKAANEAELEYDTYYDMWNVGRNGILNLKKSK